MCYGRSPDNPAASLAWATSSDRGGGWRSRTPLVTVSEKEARDSSSKAERPLDKWSSFAKAVACSFLFWKSTASCGSVKTRQVSFAFGRCTWFSPEGPSGPSSHCSPCLRMSLEEHLLFCLPPRSWRRTSFGRHNRSVQAGVSLLEVTLERAARRHRHQASWAAFGMCAERTSSRFGLSECGRLSMIWETGFLEVGSHLEQHEWSGLGGEMPGASRADVKRAVRQPLFRDLAFKWAWGVNLNVVLEALLRGPVLGLCMSGQAPGHLAELWSEGKWETGLGEDE